MIIRPDKLSHKVAAVLLWMGYICDEMIFFGTSEMFFLLGSPEEQEVVELNNNRCLK